MARLLLADDNIELVDVQQKLLEASGYEVNVALTPAEAMRELAQRPPDLILVDLRFPTAAEGLGLIRDIRETGCLLPVILLSGWPDDLYGAPEEQLVTRVVVKGSTRELLRAISELLPPLP
jgi:CheY-like chemotaxis protein